MSSKYSLIFISIILFLNISCKRENSDVKYNDTLVECKNSIDSCFFIFSKQINDVLNKDQYSLIAEYCEITTDSLNNKIKQIQMLETSINDVNFRDKLIKYCESVRNVVASYQNLGILSDEGISIQQLDSISIIIKQSEKKVKLSLNNLLQAQNKYAKEANIKLETNIKP